NEEDAFIQALLTNPGDWALRLVYADWLEERGDRESGRRAEYLRQDGRHNGFPSNPVNDAEERVFCPAFALVIDDGPCWECSMADQGGPTDTAEELRLHSPYREHLAQAFARYFMRVGLPHDARAFEKEGDVKV